MKVILISDKSGQSRSISLGRWTRKLLSLCLLGVAPLSIGALVGYGLSINDGDVLDQQALTAIKEKQSKEQQLLSKTKLNAEQHVHALTLRVAEMQARLVRLDALGERITAVAKLDRGEFDFSQIPAIGGPETDDQGGFFENPDFRNKIAETWPKEIDDSVAKRDWNWEANYGLDETLKETFK